MSAAKSFRVYVPAASAEIGRAERVVRILRESGVDVTFDWCAHMRGVAKSGARLTFAIARDSSEFDLRGVADADAVLLLEPGSTTEYRGDQGYQTVRVTTTGGWVEVGVALALRIPLIVARPSPAHTLHEWETCIFLAQASAVCADDDAAIRAVLHMAVRGHLPEDLDRSPAVPDCECDASAGQLCTYCVERAAAGAP